MATSMAISSSNCQDSQYGSHDQFTIIYGEVSSDQVTYLSSSCIHPNMAQSRQLCHPFITANFIFKRTKLEKVPAASSSICTAQDNTQHLCTVRLTTMLVARDHVVSSADSTSCSIAVRYGKRTLLSARPPHFVPGPSRSRPSCAAFAFTIMLVGTTTSNLSSVP